MRIHQVVTKPLNPVMDHKEDKLESLARRTRWNDRKEDPLC